MRHSWFAAILAAALPLLAQPDPTAIMERAKAATVIVLSGEGAGRLRSISTGVVISKDGTILTALHAVKGALEVQVRLPNGEVFDRVELLGTDERRDVAALRISAGGLAILPAGSGGALAQGAPVYAVTNADGLSWSATSGIVSVIRPADEVPGAGNGFRLIQFTAPVAPGSSGGALVDATGALVGIITRAGGNIAFAVPIESVMGLPELGSRTVLGAGATLQMPVKADPAAQRASADLAAVDPGRVVKEAHALFIRSKTSFLTVDTLDRALALQKDWPKLGVVIVADPRLADLAIEIDRPLFTYVHTFVITDKRTSIVLGSGKVTAFDGTTASGPLAKQIVEILSAAKLPAAGKPK